MKHLKLRVYDSKKKVLARLFYLDDERKVYGANTGNLIYIVPFADATITQSTGYTDINDVEIYEGDVIEVAGRGSEQGVWIVEQRDDEHFAANFYDSSRVELLSDVVYDCEAINQAEIVGNIFEGVETE